LQSREVIAAAAAADDDDGDDMTVFISGDSSTRKGM